MENPDTRFSSGGVSYSIRRDKGKCPKTTKYSSHHGIKGCNTQQSTRIGDAKRSSRLPCCRICSDLSSGIHYGVVSCEGCKGFFRRCITRKTIIAKCQKGGECQIQRTTRGRCSECRYTRCVASGMSIHSVRVGRYSKRQKIKNQVDVERLSDNNCTAEEKLSMDKNDIALYNIITNVTTAHQLTSFYAGPHNTDKDQQSTHEWGVADDMCFHDNFTSSSSSAMSPFLNDYSEFDQVLDIFTTSYFLTDVLSPSIKNIIQFAKHLHGFKDLYQEDQIILLKNGFFEIWVLRARRHMYMDHAALFRVEELATLWSEASAFSEDFDKFKLIDTEIALMTAVVLFSRDRPGLKEPEKVEELQTKLLECLCREVTRRDWKNKQILAKVLMSVTKLRNISMLYFQSMDNFRCQWTLLVDIPPLLGEMLDCEL